MSLLKDIFRHSDHSDSERQTGLSPSDWLIPIGFLAGLTMFSTVSQNIDWPAVQEILQGRHSTGHTIIKSEVTISQEPLSIKPGDYVTVLAPNPKNVNAELILVRVFVREVYENEDKIVSFMGIPQAGEAYETIFRVEQIQIQREKTK